MLKAIYDAVNKLQHFTIRKLVKRIGLNRAATPARELLNTPLVAIREEVVFVLDQM
jgi:hypothetical protein